MLEAATMGEGGWIKGEIVGHVAAAPPRDAAGAHGWYIAYVGGLTARAIVALGRRGWDAYAPTALREVPCRGRGAAGRQKQRGRLRADRTRSGRRRIAVPIYPGYVFVAARSPAPEAWDIARVPGIAYLVHRADGDVVRLADAVIEAVKERAGQSERIAAARENAAIPRCGQRVEVIEGPFAGFAGLVEEAGPDRLKVGVEIFGRTTPVALDLDQVAILA